MALTEEQIKRNDHIPTSEIIQDIADTQKELDRYQVLLSVLMENPANNRLSIYIQKALIAEREDFIKSLQSILDYRSN